MKFVPNHASTTRLHSSPTPQRSESGYSLLELLVVLAILGLIISMFTSVAFVRVAMIEITRRRKLKVMNIKPLIPFSPYDKHIQFMKARFFGVSVATRLTWS